MKLVTYIKDVQEIGNSSYSCVNPNLSLHIYSPHPNTQNCNKVQSFPGDWTPSSNGERQVDQVVSGSTPTKEKAVPVWDDKD